MGRRISVRRRKPKRSALRGIVRRYPRQGHTTAVAPLLALRSAPIACTSIYERTSSSLSHLNKPELLPLIHFCRAWKRQFKQKGRPRAALAEFTVLVIRRPVA